MYIKEKTFGENWKAVYELQRERNPTTRIRIDARLLLNQKNYIIKAKRITTVEIAEKRKISDFKYGNDT
jgi:ABC-type uncharacterized transport system auxiliary subunit